MNKHDEIKELNRRISKLEAEVETSLSELKEFQRNCDTKRSKLQGLKDRVKKLTPKDIVVSDHARIRWFERCCGFSIEEVDAKILNDSLKRCIETLGDGKFPTGDGFIAVVKNNKVVTLHEGNGK